MLIRDQSGEAVEVVALAHGIHDCEIVNLTIDASRQGEGLGWLERPGAVVAVLRSWLTDRSRSTLARTDQTSPNPSGLAAEAPAIGAPRDFSSLCYACVQRSFHCR